MKVKYINKTHRTIKLSESISVPAYGAIECEKMDSPQISKLILGESLIVVPIVGKLLDATDNKSAASVTRSRQEAMRERARLARAQQLQKLSKDSDESSVKITKTSNSNASNNKGK